MARPDLAPAGGQQPSRIGPGDRKLDQPLQRDEAEDRDMRPHRHRSNTIPAQVKPGPKAVIITRCGNPRAISFSNTNITVGALILP